MPTEPTTGPQRRALITFLFVMAFQQGVTINLLPVLFTNFAEALSVRPPTKGTDSILLLRRSHGGPFVSGFVTERIAVRRSAPLALGLAAVGALLIAAAPNFVLLRLGAMFLGMGTLWALSGNSATIGAHFASQRQKLFMWTLAVMALAGSAAPYALGHLVSFLQGWRSILFGVGLYMGASAVAVIVLFSGALQDTGLRVPSPGSRRRAKTPGETGHSMRPSARKSLYGWLAESVRWYRSSLLGQGVLLLIGFLVVIDNLTAGNIVAWTPNLCELRFGRSATLAGEIMAANAAGYLLGRIIMGLFMVGRFSDRVLLGLCYGWGMVAYSLLLWIPDPRMAIAMMVMQGVFLSAQAPTVYSLASAKFADRAGTAVPLVDAIGNIGAILGPPMMGWLAQQMGSLERAAWLIPPMGCVLVAISLGWEFKDRSGRERQG